MLHFVARCQLHSCFVLVCNEWIITQCITHIYIQARVNEWGMRPHSFTALCGPCCIVLNEWIVFVCVRNLINMKVWPSRPNFLIKIYIVQNPDKKSTTAGGRNNILDNNRKLLPFNVKIFLNLLSKEHHNYNHNCTYNSVKSKSTTSRRTKRKVAHSMHSHLLKSKC